TNVHLRVQLVELPEAARPRVAPVLEDRTTGLRYPLRADRLRIGSAEDCVVRIDGPPVLATVLLHDVGELTISTDDEDRTVAIGEEFALGGHRLVFVDGGVADGTTERVTRVLYRYRL